jgi:hypothetical protein
VAKSWNDIADMAAHCASLDAGYACLSGQPMTVCPPSSAQAARALARRRAGPARFVAAISVRTHEKDSFAALKVLSFKDFLHFAPCA